MKNRAEILEQIRRQSNISVLIIGAGINGAGLFRELALQGVDVLLVDKGDFCAGASAAPSRMIHGGLRYLENGEFRLVKESLKERNLLLKNAPHYVRPLATTIPVFNWFSGIGAAINNFFGRKEQPANRGAFIVKLGLMLYDWLTRNSSPMPRHYIKSRADSLREHPHLNPDIVCTATYYDAQISYPERLCLELIQDGEAAFAQASALNYLAFESGEKDTVTLRDELSGEVLTLKPRVVVNAAGAWIDLIHDAMRLKTQMIGGTKGSHLIIDNPQLFQALAGKMLFYENSDNRVCIMFPLFDKVLAGSTDIRVNHPDEAVTTEADIAYMLESVRQVFPSITIERSEVVFHFCGVRPLPNQSTSTTGLISRDHKCEVLEPNGIVDFPIYSLIGGKWTTFRAFAEQVADQLLHMLGKPRRQSSDYQAIGGGKNYPNDVSAWAAHIQAKTNLSKEPVLRLLHRYGTQAEIIAFFLSKDTDNPLEYHPNYSRREIEWLICQERVVHLDDVVLRRTTITLQGELTTPLLYELALIAAPLLGWSETQREAEIERARYILQTKHGVYLPAEERVN